MGQIASLPCESSVQHKAKGDNPDRKSGVEPHRQFRCLLTSFLATPAVYLMPNVMVSLFTDREGDSANWAAQILHTLPRLSALERTLQLHLGADSTRSTAVTGYKPMLHWRTARRQGSYSTVGEVIQLQWIATARLKLSSPQPVRCYPATGHLFHWVRGT